MPKKLFQKGDPRINRKGRPKDFDGVRELAREIAHEVVKDANGDPVVINQKKITVAEAILRKWATNKDPRYQIAFVEYAFGRVPQETKIDANVNAQMTWADFVRQADDDKPE